MLCISNYAKNTCQIKIKTNNTRKETARNNNKWRKELTPMEMVMKWCSQCINLIGQMEKYAICRDTRMFCVILPWMNASSIITWYIIYPEQVRQEKVTAKKCTRRNRGKKTHKNTQIKWYTHKYNLLWNDEHDAKDGAK